VKGEWNLVKSNGNTFEQGDLFYLLLSKLEWVVGATILPYYSIMHQV